MITLDGASLTLQEVIEVAERRQPVDWSPTARQRVERAHAVIETIVSEQRVVYGVTTGFGKLSDRTIPLHEINQLQLNLIRSHACGVGESLSEAETRAMMLLRANVLAAGYSGVRPLVIDTLVAMLNAGVHPVIPSKGSVGASGDLAPLAHLALGLIGEGEVRFLDDTLPAREALRKVGIERLVPGAKEGLALLNGTQGMTGVGVLCLARAQRLVELADISAAMSLEALHGTSAACDERVQSVRPYSGQIRVARRIRALTRDSQIMSSHRDCRRVQDAYSLRCIPQVHGAIRGALSHASEILSIELNAATDNPLVFAEEGEVISGGNFHGEPLALAMDYLGIAMAELGAISERRIERLVNPDLSELPAFLSPMPGTHSGMMLLQVTAVALCGENKVLAHPASVDSLPTSGNKEDHVSMGMTAALKLRQIIENVETIIAMELLAATQALDLLRPLRPGVGCERAYHAVRALVPKLEQDRVLSTDIQTVRQSLGQIVNSLEPWEG